MARDTRISEGSSAHRPPSQRRARTQPRGGLAAVLRSLLNEAPDPTPRLLCVDGASQSAGVAHPGLYRMESHALVDAQNTRNLDSIEVVFCEALVPSIVHVLVDLQPTLLVLCGNDDHPESRARLQSTLPSLSILGPGARLRIDPRGRGLHLALYEEQLNDLAQCMGPPKIALCPTPPWIPAWFSPEIGAPPCGWVHANTMDPDWLGLPEDRKQAPLIYAVPPRLEPAADPEQRLDPYAQWSLALQSIALARSFNAPLGPSWIPGPEYFAELARQLDATGAQPAPESRLDSGHPKELPAPWLDLFCATLTTLGHQAPPLPPPHLSPEVSPHIAGVAHCARQTRQSWFEVGTDAAIEIPTALDPERSLEVLRAAGPILTDHESKVVFKGFGFEVTRQAIAQSASSALSYANKIGFPVALKAISPRLLDKSKAQCVALDLPNAAAVKRAYQQIQSRAQKTVGADQLDGILVSEMIPAGIDIQIRGLRAKNSALVLLAALLPPGQNSAAPSDFIWGLAPATDAAAMRFAERILPEKLDQRELLRPELARSLRLLNRVHEGLSEGLARFDLHPLRIFTQAHTPAVLLDASIEQDSGLGW